MRRTNLAAYRVTGFEVEFANLRGRNVDVIRTGQVVVVGRAKESVAVGQDFKDAFSEDVSFFFALCLQDFEDKVLLAEAAGAREFQGARDAGKFCDVLFFQFSDGHDHLRDCAREVKGKFREKLLKTCEGSWGNSPRGRAAGGCLSSPPLRLERFFS